MRKGGRQREVGTSLCIDGQRDKTVTHPAQYTERDREITESKVLSLSLSVASAARAGSHTALATGRRSVRLCAAAALSATLSPLQLLRGHLLRFPGLPLVPLCRSLCRSSRRGEGARVVSAGLP